MTAARFCIRCGSALAPYVEEGRERLRCTGEGCGHVHYGNPTPVVAAIVEQSDEHVILVRQPGWPPKLFGLVTGFLEAGESPEDGALREVREEIGLEGKVVGIVGAYPFPQRNEVIIAYHVRADGDVVLGAELEAHKRIAIASLRPWPFGTGLAVEDFLAARRR